MINFFIKNAIKKVAMRIATDKNLKVLVAFWTSRCKDFTRLDALSNPGLVLSLERILTMTLIQSSPYKPYEKLKLDGKLLSYQKEEVTNFDY